VPFGSLYKVAAPWGRVDSDVVASGYSNSGNAIEPLSLGASYGAIKSGRIEVPPFRQTRRKGWGNLELTQARFQPLRHTEAVPFKTSKFIQRSSSFSNALKC
jgi:hypothetical protein